MKELAELAPLKHMAEVDGVTAALAFLNARVPHRLTGVYVLREGHLHSAFVFDKQKLLTPDQMAVVPLLDSFCQFAMKDGHFLVENSSREPRLDGNPNQGVVVSYHAVPIRGNVQDLFGTLCHFDMVERQLPDFELEVLRTASSILAPFVIRAAAKAGLVNSGS
jgi:GAF domain-containing protein